MTGIDLVTAMGHALILVPFAIVAGFIVPSVLRSIIARIKRERSGRP